MTTIEVIRFTLEIIGIFAVLVFLACVAGIVIAHCIDGVDIDPSEQAERDKEELLKQANKEIDHRQSMRAVRFWNF